MLVQIGLPLVRLFYVFMFSSLPLSIPGQATPSLRIDSKIEFICILFPIDCSYVSR